MGKEKIRRKPWLALLMSLFMPGLGQIYNGQMKKGLILYGIGIVFTPIYVLSIISFKLPGLILTLLIFLAIELFAVSDAYVQARKIKAISLGKYQRWYFYLLLYLLFLLVYPDLKSFVKPYKFPSGSMTPTLLPGDHFISNQMAYGFRIPFSDTRIFPSSPQRGDTIVFSYPRNPEVEYVKRVIALGGETVSIENDQVMIDGEPLEEPYAFFDPRHAGSGKSGFAPVTVPEGQLFVLGDNRRNSHDSRDWGFVEEKTVLGNVMFIYYSRDPDQGWYRAMRWDRIGEELR